jgi:hypothetical protein
MVCILGSIYVQTTKIFSTHILRAVFIVVVVNADDFNLPKASSWHAH